MARPNTVALPKLQGDLPETMVQRTVPANSVFAVGKAAAASAGRRRLTPPDLDSLVIHTNRPLVQRTTSTGIGEVWAALWARMPAGGSVDLTTAQAKSFSSWAKKQKLPFTVRKLDLNTTAVWRKA